MKRRSIARRLIASVLLVELIFAVGVIFLAAAYERHARFRAFDVMLQGRTDSLIGAVQDAEDQRDDLMFDGTGMVLPAEDVYEIRDTRGALLTRSKNWGGPGAGVPLSRDPRIYRTTINGSQYRILKRDGVRVVDPNDKGGGTPRRFSVTYGAPTIHVWHEVRNAVVFYSLSSLALLLITGLLMTWLLHRGLEPLRQLAAEAEGISVQRWRFSPPDSAIRTWELAPLASALEDAIVRLQGSFAQQRRFVSDAAHELKTAVAVVKSSLQLINMRQRTPGEYEAGIELSLADCQRMEEIVARMLMLARVEHLSGTSYGAGSGSTDLVASLRTTVEQLHSVAELRRVTLAFTAPPPIMVALPPEECSLLCSNLLLNALQHSLPHTAVRLALSVQSGWVEFRVEDEGDGIEPALLPHVFERFSRGDPSRSRNTGGTGLGLAICKAIVDKAGGSIELESELGHGATALVHMPCDSMEGS